MTGDQLIERLTSLWRRTKQYGRPVVFALDEGGREAQLRLIDVRPATLGEEGVTLITFRRTST